MKIHEALDEVGRFYIPGCVAFYDKNPLNPWQEAHERLEKDYFNASDDNAKTRATLSFVSRCKTLVEHFKKHGEPSNVVSPADALVIGNESIVKEIQSNQNHWCYVCETKEGISIEIGESGKTRVVCKEHKRKGVKNGKS